MIVKRYYLGIVFLIVLFACPIQAKAECSYSQKVRLQKLAGNVSLSYRYTQTQYSVIFQITVSNLTNELYMIDQTTGRYYYANNNDFTIDGYQPGSTIRFDFYAKDTNCSTTSIFSNYVTLPSYNPYYDSVLCKGIEEYSLCQKWLKHNMTYKEFYEGVTNYKNKPEEIEIIKEEEKGFKWDRIIEFWSKYYIYILLSIIIICGVAMYRYEKKTDL